MSTPDLPPLSPEALRRIVEELRRALVAAADRREVAAALGSLLRASGFVAPFDWQSWLADRAGARPEIDWASDPEVVAAAGLDTLRRLATVHLRTARFADGHLEALLASGYFARWLERLRELAERAGP